MISSCDIVLCFGERQFDEYKSRSLLSVVLGTDARLDRREQRDFGAKTQTHKLKEEILRSANICIQMHCVMRVTQCIGQCLCPCVCLAPKHFQVALAQTYTHSHHTTPRARGANYFGAKMLLVDIT